MGKYAYIFHLNNFWDMTETQLIKKLIGKWELVNNDTLAPKQELEIFPNGIYIYSAPTEMEESGYKTVIAQKGVEFIKYIYLNNIEYIIELINQTELNLINQTVKGEDKKYIRIQ